MKNDFEPVLVKFPLEQKLIRIYPIADCHIGSRECDEDAIKRWVEIVKSDAAGYCVIAGDMCDMGLKSSKTNCYEETMPPHEQKERFYELFSPISDKILAIVPGNHEGRCVREVGLNPLYDIACRWRIEDRYRENACFLEVAVGQKAKDHKGRQNVYGIVVTHGTSRNKYINWTSTIDGADLFISGHVHENDEQDFGKLVFDHNAKQVRQAEYIKHICTPFMRYGGYALNGHYRPSALPKLEVFTLMGDRKKIEYSKTVV